MRISIRNENDSDFAYVEAMTRYCFWNVYKPGCDEHVMVHNIRKSKDYIKKLDFVAELDGKIVGHILCSKSKICDDFGNVVDYEHIISIGPICVLPQWQSKGIGSLLIEQVKSVAMSMGYKGINLYGNPAYYHRFGFVDAKEYGISTPDGSNMDAFMVVELKKGGLDKIQGRCHESDAFNVSANELNSFEQKFIGRWTENSEKVTFDYSRIKQEFENSGKTIPINLEDNHNLTKKEQLEINPCGTYCGDCEDYGVVCDGCRNRDGRPLWYALFDKEETCGYYSCTKEKGLHDCSQCTKMPCAKYFEYPDPNMSDDFKQYWFKLRMENFNQINIVQDINVKDTYKENEESFNNKK